MKRILLVLVVILIIGSGPLYKNAEGIAPLVPVTRAQELTLTPPKDLLTTIWNPMALTSNFLTNYYFKAGNKTVFHGVVANYAYNTPQTVLVTIQIYNEQNNNKVGQVNFDRVHFEPFQEINFELPSPLNLQPGNYFYTVGVYKESSNNLLGWYPGYQHFTVTK